MNLTIKNTIEDYRDVHNYIYTNIIMNNKILFNIFKILLYVSPWGVLLLQWKITSNMEQIYIIILIVLSRVIDILFNLVFKNNYHIKWLINLSLIRIKNNKFAISDKILESHQTYIKIFNEYGEIRFNKKDKSDTLRFSKGLIITNKRGNDAKRFIFVPNRSFENDNEINQLISYLQ